MTGERDVRDPAPPTPTGRRYEDRKLALLEKSLGEGAR